MHGDFVLKESQRIEKYTSLVGIYEQYETILKERGFIDFSDMILQSILLIEEHPDIRANLAEQYQWIMIDEYPRIRTMLSFASLPIFSQFILKVRVYSLTET